MTTLRSRVGAWVGRKYLARTQKKGFNLAKMSFLPDAALMPLKRDGLDPLPELAAKRETEPISRIPLPFGMNAWLVSGYDEAKAVLANATAFSNDFTNLVGGNAGLTDDQNPGGLGFADPPAHTRLRKALTPEFTMRRLARLTPRIDAIVNGQLDAMAAAEGPIDLATMFALPIPSLTICELLGVPYEDRDEFQRQSGQRFVESPDHERREPLCDRRGDDALRQYSGQDRGQRHRCQARDRDQCAPVEPGWSAAQARVRPDLTQDVAGEERRNLWPGGAAQKVP